MDGYRRMWYRGENLDDQDNIFFLRMDVEEEECE